MKSVFTVLLAILSLSALQAQEAYKVPGFRNMTWGVHKDSVYRSGERLNFNLDKKAEEVNSYFLQNENLTLGNARLLSINYIFNDDNRFSKVKISGSMKYIDDINFILQHKFGSPKDVERVTGDYEIREWQTGDVSFRLSTTRGDNFILTIDSNWERTESYIKNTSVTDF